MDNSQSPCGSHEPSHTRKHSSPATIEFLHRKFLEGEFWREIPGYAHVDDDTFSNPMWQLQNSVTSPQKLELILGHLVTREFLDDFFAALSSVSMSVRLTPYIVSLINWDHPAGDPLRRQFIPLKSQQRADHPKVTFDSLAEQVHSPVEGLIHRYHDKVLFLTLNICPIYCRFCTRSYAVGQNTTSLEKAVVRPDLDRWDAAIEYIRAHEHIEDVILSGGDTYLLRPQHIRYLGDALLGIEHVRRIRFATRGLAVLPMKILRDEAWTKEIIRVARIGRKRHREVMIHTHFNHPNEMTFYTRDALNRLFENGLTIRNQSVLLRGVNDDSAVMKTLIKKLSTINIHPYYVFQHDLVKGVEDLRTRLADTITIEKEVRGLTAGYNSPAFVVDTQGGGGKRDVHSFEAYDPVTGVSVYRSPIMNREATYFHFDPIDLLPPEGQKRWSDPREHQAILDDALRSVRMH